MKRPRTMISPGPFLFQVFKYYLPFGIWYLEFIVPLLLGFHQLVQSHHLLHGMVHTF